MKKKCFSLAVLLVGFIMSPCSVQAQEYKVGITVQSLKNSYWKGVFSHVDQILQQNGWDYNILSCDDDSDTQTVQIRSFINWDADLIMVHPSDADAIEDICKEAQEKGIKVMCWDDEMENSDLNWILDNEELGQKIGEAAAKFINRVYDGNDPVETAVINYPDTDVLAVREENILDALEKKASGKYKIIASVSALEPGVALTQMEEVLKEYPECQVVCSVGAGGCIGANSAFSEVYGKEIPDNVGIFSADATEAQLEAIVNREATSVIIGMEGSDTKTAVELTDLLKKLLMDDTFESKNIIRPLMTIDNTNAEEILREY